MKTDLINLDFKHSSFPRRREISVDFDLANTFWIPAYAGMNGQEENVTK